MLIVRIGCLLIVAAPVPVTVASVRLMDFNIVGVPVASTETVENVFLMIVTVPVAAAVMLRKITFKTLIVGVPVPPIEIVRRGDLEMIGAPVLVTLKM